MLFGITAAGFVALVRHLGSFGAVPVATAALFAAAAWELTPWKRRALRSCRLVAPLPPRGRNANRACVKASVRQAFWCTAGCWCLMLAVVAIAAGVYVMGVLTVLIVAENVAARGPRFTLPAAGVIASVALVLAVA
jgi:predicted metal-binding membrane protein